MPDTAPRAAELLAPAAASQEERTMTVYIAADETARYIAREYIIQRVIAELERGSLKATVGDLAADGTCSIYLRAEPATFSLSDYFETPQIDGRAWIEEGPRARVVIEFLGENQPTAFMVEHRKEQGR